MQWKPAQSLGSREMNRVYHFSPRCNHTRQETYRELLDVGSLSDLEFSSFSPRDV
jgi:hypothetical protein